MPAALTLSKPPKLGKHQTTGKYRISVPVQLGGGSRWFGVSPEAAQKAYQKWVDEVWPCLLGSSVTASPVRPNRRGMNNASLSGFRLPTDDPTPSGKGMTVKQTADSLFALVDSESGPAGQKNVRWRLRLFIEKYGSRPMASLTPADLIQFKGELAKKYKPEFINNILSCVRRLCVFAYETSAIDKPIRMGVLKAVPKGALPKKGIAPEQVRELIEEVAKHNRPLAVAMLVQFYCVLRPSECCKILYGVGNATDYGMEIESKTTRRSGELRAVLIHAKTRALIEEFRKTSGSKYKSHNAYRLAVNVVGRTIGDKRLMEIIGKKGALAPHFLRHSATDALRMAKPRVPDEYIRVAQGRLMPRVERAYSGDNYLAARDAILCLPKMVPRAILDPIGSRGFAKSVA